MRTVAALRSAGYRVGVSHIRPTYKQVFADNGKDTQMYRIVPRPRGGRTLVRVTAPDGTTVAGVSACSKSDPYNRKTGVAIALGRAFGGVYAYDRWVKEPEFPNP